MIDELWQMFFPRVHRRDLSPFRLARRVGLEIHRPVQPGNLAWNGLSKIYSNQVSLGVCGPRSFSILPPVVMSSPTLHGISDYLSVCFACATYGAASFSYE